MGFLFSFLLLFLNAEVIPRADQRSQEVFEEMRRGTTNETEGVDSVSDLARNLTLRNQAGDRFWFIERLNRETGQALGIRMQDWADEEQNQYRTVVAREGFFDERDETWRLQKVRETVVHAQTGEVLQSVPHAEWALQTPGESSDLMVLLAERPKDLSLFELNQVRRLFADPQDQRRLDYDLLYHRIWAGSFICLMVVSIAIPFSISGVRRSPYIGVSKSIFLFAGFYLVQTTFDYFANHGVLQPIPASWLPVGVFFLVGLYFFHRSNYPDGA